MFFFIIIIIPSMLQPLQSVWKPKFSVFNFDESYDSRPTIGTYVVQLLTKTTDRWISTALDENRESLNDGVVLAESARCIYWYNSKRAGSKGAILEKTNKVRGAERPLIFFESGQCVKNKFIRSRRSSVNGPLLLLSLRNRLSHLLFLLLCKV